MNYIDSMKDYQLKEPHRFLVGKGFLGDTKCKGCILKNSRCVDKRSSQVNIKTKGVGTSYIWCATWHYHKNEIENSIKLNRDNQKAVLFIIQ